MTTIERTSSSDDTELVPTPIVTTSEDSIVPEMRTDESKPLLTHKKSHSEQNWDIWYKSAIVTMLASGVLLSVAVIKGSHNVIYFFGTISLLYISAFFFIVSRFIQDIQK